MRQELELVNESCSAIVYEVLENMAYQLSKRIINKYKLRCIKEGSPLGYTGEKAIRNLVQSKMKVVASVSITMQELDKLLPKGE